MKKENVLGIVLIFAGLAWIIDITGLIAINWGQAIKSLWPIIFIALGISLLAGKNKTVNIILWILVLVVFTAFGIYKGNEPDLLMNNGILRRNIHKVNSENSVPFEKEVDIPQGTEKGKIILNLGAVNLNISEGSRDLFVKADSNIPDLRQSIDEGKQTIIEYSREGHDNTNTVRDFNIKMNPGLLWEIEGNLGAVDGKIDLSSVPAERINLTIGAGDLDVIIGEQNIDTEISLRAGAADMEIIIPKNAGLIVRGGKMLTDLTFHNINMEQNHDEYYSENYKKANQIIELNIQTAISSIQIFAK